MYAMENGCYLELKIDGQELPSRPNVLNKVVLTENISTTLPMLLVDLNDAENYFSNQYALNDGNLLAVTIGKDVGSLATKTPALFRLFSDVSPPYSTGYHYIMNALYDCPLFSLDKTAAAYLGTSSSVMQQIAAKCRLQSETDPTSDSQVWINLIDSCNGFTNKIQRYSYCNNGLMALVLTADNKLLYKDILGALRNKPAATLSMTADTTKGEIQIKQLKFHNNSGFFNAWLNYGFSVIEPTLSGSINNYSATTLGLSESFVPINSDVKAALNQVKQEYAPLDCGNTHPLYWKAYHDNIRRTALFNRVCTVLVTEVTDLRPSDCVNLVVYDHAGKGVDQRSGNYIVAAKNRILEGVQYAETFELLRCSTNTAGNNNLVG